MNYTHPMVVRIEREHNYARPWHKKINAQQKYPNRLTRFLFLRNFPRHFLSRYPNAFSSKQDGTIEVGSPEDLKYPHIVNVKEELIEVDDSDLVEQENTNRLAGDTNDDNGDNDGLKKEEPLLDTSTWTQQMDRLYFRTLQIFQEHYITKLVYENLPNGPIRMVSLLENTSLQLRHSFGNIAGWDNELLVWLHNLFTTKLPMHDHLMDTYHEVMQYLSKRLPRLIDRFYPNPDRIPPSIATTPITSAATTPVHPSSGGGGGGGEGRQTTGQRSRHSSMSHHHQQVSNYLTLEEDPAAKFVLENTRAMPRRLTSNPIILLVPSGPSMPSQPTSARMDYWKSLLSSMGQLINVNIPYRPEQTAPEILQVIKTSVRDKIRDTMRKKFNELRPLLLVGFNQGSLISVHCALDNPGQVAAIICLGFPMTALNGFRGDLDDPLLDLDIPILFVIGQMATTATIGALERLRESMPRSDTGLVVIGGANDKLIMCYKKKLYDGVTQYHVDKSIADEIYNFVNSIHMQPPEGYA
uniref:KAT8 regulatory NSL complex subunit 3 n=1 Tax=Aceria tosichella TaxID=561515 RepID=A0A6G1SDS7_9ACAR